ncbi:hypothetical protein PoB_003223000 [Plakobranchus ocellatus]|uniref:Uncharacterized protein n=1 Tax=Plakobranchus ocellatus TaxID=259542 RepID=A0AAV4AC29_9GAST|nr:hypothetical protein PoB_003223000 [Plakobranchus ocellatus]
MWSQSQPAEVASGNTCIQNFAAHKDVLKLFPSKNVIQATVMCKNKNLIGLFHSCHNKQSLVASSSSSSSSSSTTTATMSTRTITTTTSAVTPTPNKCNSSKTK